MAPDRPAAVERARRILEEWLRPARHGPRAPFEVSALHLDGEPITLAQARRRRFAPFRVGDRYGRPWSTTWFRLRASIPEEWAGCDVDALVDGGHRGQPGFGAEALVYRHGRAVCGLSWPHRTVALARPAQGEEAIELMVEAAANPPLPSVRALPDPAPLLMPEPEAEPMLRLEAAELAVSNREVEALYHDWRVLLELAVSLGEGEPRAEAVLATLEAAGAALDPDRVEATAGAARELLAPQLARRATGGHAVSAAGHAHIDTAWLWPLRETRRKVARTAATALELMDDHPEYRFVCSQPAQYEMLRTDHPELFHRVRERVDLGQWEPVGSMWVEADCNLPGGEALVRQLVCGKRWLRDHLGVETLDLWLPDVFGCPASLPQLMRLAGVRWFVTQKLSWNETNRMPHTTFWWEGIDGSRVLAHLPPADTYNGEMGPRELLASVRGNRDRAACDRSLYLFGVGDGGGGPTRDMLEAARRCRDLEGLPRVRLEGARAFFERVESEAGELATWVGELYLETHRGTYTTQARTKARNRRAQAALRDAELLSALAPGGLSSYPAETLEVLWRRLLTQQFHDILPGSGIHWVHRESEAELGAVVDGAEGIAAAAAERIAAAVDTSSLAAPFVVLNTTAHRRREPVALGDAGLALVDVPPCGHATLDAAAVGRLPAGVAPVEADGRTLDNGLLRVSLDGDGLIASILDLEAGREVVAAGRRANQLQLFEDLPADYDAWNLDAETLRREPELLTACEELALDERGPLRAGIRVRRRFGRSSITQRLRLAAGSRVLAIVTEVDWHEDHRLLKAAFPLAVRSARATHEIQWGHVERPTHRNTPWDAARFETCAQRWVDLWEPGYGVALLNDSKHGHDVVGDTIRISLLRAPTSPDPLADRGAHRFTYALLPHRGDPLRAGVIEAAADLNTPLRVLPSVPRAGPLAPRHSFVSCDAAGCVVETVKRADEGRGLVLRLYEAHGARGVARLRLGLPSPPASARRADLLERPLADAPKIALDGAELELELRPFEIVTLVLS